MLRKVLLGGNNVLLMYTVWWYEHTSHKVIYEMWTFIDSQNIFLIVKGVNSLN